jgi:hypothetical protein
VALAVEDGCGGRGPGMAAPMRRKRRNKGAAAHAQDAWGAEGQQRKRKIGDAAIVIRAAVF